MHSPESVQENETHTLLRNFEIQTDLQSLARRPHLIIINKKNPKKQENLQNCWLTFEADHGVKLKECEKRDKYIDLARELKILWNMKVMIIPIVTGALGTVTKRLLKGLETLEIRARMETIQTTALLRSARILRRVLETWENLLSLKLQWTTIS